MMTQQYNDLVNTVNLEIQEEDKIWAQKKRGRILAIRIFLIVSLLLMPAFMMLKIVVSFWGLPMENPLEVCAYTFGLLGIVLLFVYGYAGAKIAINIMQILSEECNPQKMLSRYAALLVYKKADNSWGVDFYQICLGLFYVAQYEDIKKVLQLFPKYCYDKDSRFRYEYVWAKLAAHEKNEEMLQMHCGHLSEFIQDNKLKKKYEVWYKDTIQSLQLLQMEKAGDMENAYRICCEMSEKAHNTLERVVWNYNLYQLEKEMGNEENAEKHRQVVLYYGGTTWMKRKLEED